MKYYQLINDVKKINREYEALLYLITEIAGYPKTVLYAHLDDEIPEDTLKKINIAIRKYTVENIPVQYIIGYTYFYGLKIFLDRNVLIPRQETEEVVERVIIESKKYKNAKIVDVCTGSGCIAIALKKNIPDAEITAIDISSKALSKAKENAKYYDLKINFLENDLLSNINEKYDIIVSNPPYIDPDTFVMPLVYDNEPHLALFSKNLYHYKMILKQAKRVLKKNGVIIFEIAYDKREEIEALAKKYFAIVKTYKDLNQNNRIMVIR